MILITKLEMLILVISRCIFKIINVILNFLFNISYYHRRKSNKIIIEFKDVQFKKVIDARIKDLFKIKIFDLKNLL